MKAAQKKKSKAAARRSVMVRVRIRLTDHCASVKLRAMFLTCEIIIYQTFFKINMKFSKLSLINGVAQTFCFKLLLNSIAIVNHLTSPTFRTFFGVACVSNNKTQA